MVRFPANTLNSSVGIIAKSGLPAEGIFSEVSVGDDISEVLTNLILELKSSLHSSEKKDCTEANALVTAYADRFFKVSTMIEAGLCNPVRNQVMSFIWDKWDDIIVQRALKLMNGQVTNDAGEVTNLLSWQEAVGMLNWTAPNILTWFQSGIVEFCEDDNGPCNEGGSFVIGGIIGIGGGGSGIIAAPITEDDGATPEVEEGVGDPNDTNNNIGD